MKTFLTLGLLTVGALQAQAPEGWTYRLDAPQSLRDTQDLAPGEWRYTRMPPGWHVTTTDAGVVLQPEGRTLHGRWGIEVELFLFPNPSDAPLGISLEPADLPPGSVQLRFVMRRDGQAALIGLREGRDTLLAAWTADTAATPHGGGVDRYVLRLMHEANTLAFSINGHEMLALPTGGEDNVAIPGLRIGPGLNVHVSRYDLLTPLAPPRPRRSGM